MFSKKSILAFLVKNWVQLLIVIALLVNIPLAISAYRARQSKKEDKATYEEMMRPFNEKLAEIKSERVALQELVTVSKKLVAASERTDSLLAIIQANSEKATLINEARYEKIDYRFSLFTKDSLRWFYSTRP